MEHITFTLFRSAAIHNCLFRTNEACQPNLLFENIYRLNKSGAWFAKREKMPEHGLSQWRKLYIILSSSIYWDLAHPDGKIHWANIGPIWGRQDPGGPHVGPMNFAIWADLVGIVALTRMGCFEEISYLTMSGLWLLLNICMASLSRTTIHFWSRTVRLGRNAFVEAM